MKNELINIITQLRETIEETKLYGVSNQSIFEQACSFVRGKQAGESRIPKNFVESKIEPATQRQKATLISIGKWKEGLSKSDAWKIINTNNTQ